MAEFEYYIIPAEVMARDVREAHQKWLRTPGRKGQEHKDSTMRAVSVHSPGRDYAWDVRDYKNRWDLINDKLKS